jgi:tryptophan synthase alpha chain
MSRIAQTFAQLKQVGKTAFIPFATIGFPELNSTVEIVLAMVEAGADIVELGVPFSDPLADGATIQRINFKALENGVTTPFCFETVRTIRAKTEVPLIFMGYYNPIFSYGVEKYVQSCAEAGIDGLIVPDLALEEADELLEQCRKYNIDLIFLVAPTSTDERLQIVAQKASGFVYCVSLTGVTGARSALPDYLPAYLQRVRQFIDLPLAVGFGISQREHVKGVSELAEGVIVASALLDRLEKAEPSQRLTVVKDYIKELTGTN